MKKPKLKTITKRGRNFVGTVINDKAQKTVTVEWYWKQYVPKYERSMSKRTKVKAHNPDAIKAVKGDRVRICECRPLSKTKKFIVVEKLGKDISFLEKAQIIEEEKPEEKANKKENETDKS